MWYTGSVVAAPGLSCSVACGIFWDQGWNPCPLHWQEDSHPLYQQGSLLLLFFFFFLLVLIYVQLSREAKRRYFCKNYQEQQDCRTIDGARVQLYLHSINILRNSAHLPQPSAADLGMSYLPPTSASFYRGKHQDLTWIMCLENAFQCLSCI